MSEKLSRNAELAQVFAAAADGVMEPFGLSNRQMSAMQNSPGGFSSRSFDGKSYDSAKQLQGILYAISRVYAELAKGDSNA